MIAGVAFSLGQALGRRSMARSCWCRGCFRRMWRLARMRRLLPWALPAALLLEPIRSTLTYGQINALLMALVAFDCLTRAPRWPRGIGVGIAAAVKLTPAVFLLFFLLRRDLRSAARAGLSFAACTGAGFALAPHDSLETLIAFNGLYDRFEVRALFKDPGDPESKGRRGKKSKSKKKGRGSATR